MRRLPRLFRSPPIPSGELPFWVIGLSASFLVLHLVSWEDPSPSCNESTGELLVMIPMEALDPRPPVTTYKGRATDTSNYQGFSNSHRGG
jgi:hypothetical protein